MEARLWAYIDGIAAPAEHTEVEQLIAQQAAWKAKYAELMEVHSLINLSELEQPSMRFTRNVMEEIARLQITPAARRFINNKVIWSIGVFFITVIVGFLVYGFGQVNWHEASDPGSTLGIDLTRVNYGTIFNNQFVNGFLMLNVVLGLMLLDRYLNNRKKQWTREA